MLKREFRNDLEIERKARHDFVTDVDVAVEEAVLDVLSSSEHAVHGEETGVHPGDDKTWIVDPLDGTTNYILGTPSFASMVALVDEGTVDTDLAQRCLPSIGRDSPFWTDITVLGPEDDGVTVL